MADVALESTLAGGSSGGAQAGSRFAPGTVLANRYELVRFIAAGGMGEVYEARDREHDGTGALKTIRRDRGNPLLEELFRREIQIARKITHPNVCRTFDLGFHDDIMFLTMELLEGQTLSQRIHQAGQIPVAEALSIVRHVVRALDAAHAVNVIHRDLKSQNIMLTNGRAVVMDFGLAHAAGNPAGDATVSDSDSGSGSGHLVGTPQYMAPEQVTGSEVTRAADIYSLGVVMFEMVTGALPFEGPTPLAVATRRLTDDAPSARIKRPDLSRIWTDTIARCLKREPGDRFGRARDVIEALSSGRSSRRWIAIALLVAIVAVVGAIGLVLHGRSPRTPQSARSRSVAVLGFRNTGGEVKDAWLATGLADMLTTELSNDAGLRVVSADRVALARARLGLDAGSVTPEGLRSLHSDLGADVVVTGSYVAIGDAAGHRLRIDVRLVDTATGATVIAFDETGTDARLFELVNHAGDTLRQRLGDRAPAAPQHVALAPDPEALRLYTEGIAARRAFDWMTARKKLEAAVAAAPGFALAHVELARTLTTLREDRGAEAEARRAFETGTNLPRRDKLVVEAVFGRATKDWDAAAKAYRSLIDEFPDDAIDYGSDLISVLLSAGRTSEAMGTLTSLRSRFAAVDDPRFDLDEARIAGAVSDYAHQRDAATKAAESANAHGAALLEANARLIEANASRRLGDLERTTRAMTTAIAIYDKLGDKLGGAKARHSDAGALIDKADLLGAKREEEAALDVFVAAGDRNDAQDAYSNLAEALQDLGDLAAARARYEQAREIASQLGERGNEAGSLLNLGTVALYLGDTDKANEAAGSALAIFRETHEAYGEALAVGLSGQVARARGDLATARKATDDAIALLHTAGSRMDELQAQVERAGIDREQGDRKAAHAALGGILADCKPLHLDRICADASIELARLDIDEKHFPEAARVALDAAASLQAAGAADTEAIARSLASRALAGSHDAAGAKRELTRAHELAARTQNPSVAREVAAAASP